MQNKLNIRRWRNSSLTLHFSSENKTLGFITFKHAAHQKFTSLSHLLPVLVRWDHKHAAHFNAEVQRAHLHTQLHIVSSPVPTALARTRPSLWREARQAWASASSEGTAALTETCRSTSKLSSTRWDNVHQGDLTWESWDSTMWSQHSVLFSYTGRVFK